MPQGEFITTDPERARAYAALVAGTYVREPDGATLLYHSETRWNSPVDGLRASMSGRSLYRGDWRIVGAAEAAAAHTIFALRAGEYAEHFPSPTSPTTTGDDDDDSANKRRAMRGTAALEAYSQTADARGEELSTLAQDLIADILHALAYAGEPVDHPYDMAKRHYDDERAEGIAANRHDDDEPAHSGPIPAVHDDHPDHDTGDEGYDYDDH